MRNNVRLGAIYSQRDSEILRDIFVEMCCECIKVI